MACRGPWLLLTAAAALLELEPGLVLPLAAAGPGAVRGMVRSALMPYGEIVLVGMMS